MTSPRADYETLATLLASMFASPDELRALLAAYFPEVIKDLPPRSVPLIYFIHDAVRILDRRGLLDDGFFLRLMDVMPARKSEISTFATLWRSGREIPRSRVDSGSPSRAQVDPGLAAMRISTAVESASRYRLPAVKRRCGLVMPISAFDGLSSSHWKNVADVVMASLPAWSFSVVQVRDEAFIQRDFIEAFKADPVVIVDLSVTNVNVAIALGVRLGAGKPVVLIRSGNAVKPIDVEMMRCLIYPHDLLGPQRLGFMRALREAVEGEAEPSLAAVPKDANVIDVSWQHSIETRVDRLEQILGIRPKSDNAPLVFSSGVQEPVSQVSLSLAGPKRLVPQDLQREEMLGKLIAAGAPRDLAAQDVSDALRELGDASFTSVREWWIRRNNSR